MALANYLDYLQKNLGLKEIMMSPEALHCAAAAHSQAQSEVQSQAQSQVQPQTQTQPSEVESQFSTAEVGIESASTLETAVAPEFDNQSESIVIEWENNPSLGKGVASVLFLRVSSGVPPLKEDAGALDLFEKLRKAIGFDSRTGPWAEVSLAHWQEALHWLRPQFQRILIMADDRVEKGLSEGREWMIPDPAVLAAQIELKRPTWELLKDWKSQS